MGLRWTGIGVAAGLVGWFAGCGAAAAFACRTDADCALGGVPGSCEGDGRCAYPDDACPSGFSYPVATPDVGGTCVPDEGTAGDDGDGGGAEADGTTQPPLSTDDTGSGATSGGTTTMLPDSGQEASSSPESGGEVCPDEVGDEVFTAEVLSGCAVEVESDLTTPDDLDWYALFGPDAQCNPGLYSATLSAADDSGAEICLGAGCEGGVQAAVACTAGMESALSGGVAACCGGQTVAGTFGCPDRRGVLASFDPFVVVYGARTTPLCTPYSFVVQPLE